MIQRAIIILLIGMMLSCLPFNAMSAAPSYDTLRSEFASPPDTAKPLVWWHWMNGNITLEGIKLDLEWMRRVGVGGLQTFDASIDTPVVVDRPLVFMTPPWNEAFRYAVTLADQLKLEFAIAGSPGFSESGGPWVPPERGMKKLVWSEIHVKGGTPFVGRLPQPAATTGPFQDVPVDRGPESFGGPPPAKPVPEIYHDVAVIAYRLPANDRTMEQFHPMVTSSGGPVDTKALWDEGFTHVFHLPEGTRDHLAWILVDFGRPRTVQSMSLGLQESADASETHDFSATLESSEDGIVFHHIANAYDTNDSTYGVVPPVQQTLTFAPITQRYFRLSFPPASSEGSQQSHSRQEHRISQFVLYSTPRVDHFEQKAGFFLDTGRSAHTTLHVSRRDVLSPKEIVDVTSYLRADGRLDWSVPQGRWAILRIGYSLLGITNHPPTPAATGLEVDKLSRSAVRAYMDDYLRRYEAIVGPGLVGARGVHAAIVDSYEAGPQNWTEELPVEFARRRGYDLHLWLPAVTGRIIGSAEATDRFLWDFRRTLGELIAEYHYQQIAAALHARGMINYGESHEASRMFIGDGMDAKRYVDVPMGAMWMSGQPDRTQAMGDADIRESASVAHLYGQNLVAAESMTAEGTAGTAYDYAPESLKVTADRELSDGLNLFVIHTSVHQPLVDRGPGLTLGPYGQWFTRNETWAEQAGPWMTYLARSSYLLQQGHFVADILFYYGQDSNITALYGDHLPSIPAGYAFDFANADSLTKLVVREGHLVTHSQMDYRLLVLDPRARLMSFDVLNQIGRLVAAGATVVGAKPEGTPSLSDNPGKFAALVDKIWGSQCQGERHYGLGRVFCGVALPHVLPSIQLQPDFSYSREDSDTNITFVHRRLEDGDCYFVNNQGVRVKDLRAQFRIKDLVPQLWHADTGRIEATSYRQENDRTVVPLHLDPHEAVFVLFHGRSSHGHFEVTPPVEEALGTITGPWQVRFQPGRGAPGQATFEKLQSWTTNSDPGIRYFSGSADYQIDLRAPQAWLTNTQRLKIDLGEVKNMAEVIVNGRSAGIAWKKPYEVDVTGFVKSGSNNLVVRVTNLWPNRLIGDKQPGATSIGFTSFNPYHSDSPLRDSGLMGPVTILRVGVVRDSLRLRTQN